MEDERMKQERKDAQDDWGQDITDRELDYGFDDREGKRCSGEGC